MEFFAVIDTEKKSHEAKEKQKQEESLKQMNRTLTIRTIRTTFGKG